MRGPLEEDDERVERREDVYQLRSRVTGVLRGRWLRPILLLARAFKRDRHHFLAANARLDQAPDLRLARCVEMADRIEADDALRAQGAVEQISRDFARRSALRRLVPAKMPRHQLIGLEHAVALRDRKPAFVE